MTAPVANNLKRNLAFRENVAMVMRRGGLANAKPAKVHRISEAFANPTGHIDGLANFEILVQASVRARPSEGLDDAAALAKQSGKHFSAIILDRPERSAADAYVIMTLSQFSLLAANYEAEAER